MKICFTILFLHGSHRSNPSRGKACFSYYLPHANFWPDAKITMEFQLKMSVWEVLECKRFDDIRLIGMSVLESFHHIWADGALIPPSIASSSVLEVMGRKMVVVKLCRTSISAVLVAYPARLTSLSGNAVRSEWSVTLAHYEANCLTKIMVR